MAQQTYGYLSIPERAPKPRRVGCTLVQDKGTSHDGLEAIFRTVGGWIDYYKPSSMYHAVFEESFTFGKLQLALHYDIKPFMGGNVLELAYLQGVLEAHLDYTKDHGWQAIEISETYVQLPETLKLQLIERYASEGLEVFYEWGEKTPSQPLDPDAAAADIERYLGAGVSVAILEQGEIDLLVGQDGRALHADRLKALFERVGPERLMIESTSQAQLGWFMREMGTAVNVGNVALDQAAEIEALRRGIGRAVDYAIYDPWLADPTRTGSS